jgi:hypothetical protein
MKTYELTIKDDQVAEDFEAGLKAAGMTVTDLFQKEVGDFAQSHRTAEQQKTVTPVERPDVSEEVEVKVDGEKLETASVVAEREAAVKEEQPSDVKAEAPAETKAPSK